VAVDAVDGRKLKLSIDTEVEREAQRRGDASYLYNGSSSCLTLNGTSQVPFFI
jgi:hypothetical protein